MAETLSLLPADLDLDVIQEEHALWLASAGKEGRRAHFRRADLTEVNLSGYKFQEASMRGITIRNVNFSGADLRGCDMAESQLRNVNLRGALLSAATLTRAQLQNVDLDGADLSGAMMMGMGAKDSSFREANLHNVNLRDANISANDFSHANLQEANLRSAVCVATCFDNADLSSAECRDGTFDHASFAAAKMMEANFKGASLSSVDLRATDFSEAVDVVFDIKTQTVFAERDKLAEEMRYLETRNAAIEESSLKLKKKEADIIVREARCELALKSLGWIKTAYSFLALFWCAISVILLKLTFSRLAHLSFSKVAGIVAGVGMVLILSFLSLYFAVKSRKILMGAANREPAKIVTKKKP